MLQLTTGPRFTRPGKPMDEVERYSWILEFMPHDKRAYLPRYPNKQCSNLCVLLSPECCPKLSERLCPYHLGNANRAVTVCISKKDIFRLVTSVGQRKKF